MRIGRDDRGRLVLVERGAARDVTRWATQASALRTEDPMIAFIDAVGSGARPEGEPLEESQVRWSAPLRRPGKIIAAAANYWKHTREMNPGQQNLGGIREKGFFLKAPTSIIGPGDAIRLPFADRRTDHEAELAVVIGTGGKHIAEARALDHVFGYTCLLDITMRGKEDRGLRKSFDTFTPMGPWIATADEIRDPNALGIRCVVNGETRQDDTTASMIMNVPALIAWMSQVMTLESGDVVATGTPAGVAPLAAGDRIEVTIERIGTLAVGVGAA